MNITAIHPTFAVDLARTREVEFTRHAEQVRRAKAFRADPVRRPATRRRWLAWSPFGLRPVT